MLTTSEIIKKYNLYTKKSFGQNFLTNPELLIKIVNCAGNIENTDILEIGTGPAGLTSAILSKNPKKLITIDMDERCINIAKNEIQPFYKNLEIIHEDALKINEKDLFKNKYKIIANLPYNIGTVLLFKWLENDIKDIDSITLLLQKEVVDRIIASNNNKNYGRVSVMCQYLCDVKKHFDIAPTAFFPPPKVISSVITLKPKENINYNLIKPLSSLCKLLFSQRRKTVLNNLKNKYKNAEDILNKSNIKFTNRVEELSINDFLNIIKSI